MANTISPLEKQGKSVEHNLLIFHQLESTKMLLSEYYFSSHNLSWPSLFLYQVYLFLWLNCKVKKGDIGEPPDFQALNGLGCNFRITRH